MATPAYSTTIKVGGTPVPFTEEPTTKVTANTVYQITDATRRVLDPGAAVTVEVDAAGDSNFVAADPDDYEVDYLFGKIVFAEDQGADAVVRISGSYVPLLAVAGAREFSLTELNEILDSTRFNEGDAWRRKAVSLQDASGSVSVIELLNEDLGDGMMLHEARRDGTPVLLEVRPGGTGDFWRGWVLLENTEESGAVDGLVEGTINFQSAPQHAAGFGWGT